MMKRLFFTALLLTALIVPASGQEPRAQPGADNSSAQEASESTREALYELDAAVRSYRAGNFVEAQHHSERALELDPSQPIAPFFIARAIHAQFRQRNETPENIAIARAAILAYQRILERWPDSDEAFNAVAFLYGAIKEDGNQRDWMMRRALDASVASEKRAEAYVFLAGLAWDCSFRVTEDNENKYTTVANGRATIRFKKPKSGEDFDRAMLCTTRALEEAEMAITLEPNNSKAWRYKTNILREAQKLAEMEGKIKKATRLWREAEAAQKRTFELNQKNAEDKQSEQPATNP